MSETDLTALRHDIDAIDAEIHSLLIRRAALSERIRGVKVDGSLKLRPGREANILRALVARHEGPFPKGQLVRIWRDILNASLAMQGPFSVGAYATETAHDFWDLTRDHFGGGAQLHKFGTARRVVEAVASGECSIGVLPQPAMQETENWWQYLVAQPNSANQGRPLRVILKLPFVQAIGNDTPDGYVIARSEPEASGEDRTLLAIDLKHDHSTDGLHRMIGAAGFFGTFRARWHDSAAPQRWVHLLEVGGFIRAEDKRIVDAAEAFDGDLNQIIVVGAFAEPLNLDEAAAKKAATAPRARAS